MLQLFQIPPFSIRCVQNISCHQKKNKLNNFVISLYMIFACCTSFILSFIFCEWAWAKTFHIEKEKIDKGITSESIKTLFEHSFSSIYVLTCFSHGVRIKYCSNILSSIYVFCSPAKTLSKFFHPAWLTFCPSKWKKDNMPYLKKTGGQWTNQIWCEAPPWTISATASPNPGG